jgi:Flp pilus assembly pilin Flp
MSHWTRLLAVLARDERGGETLEYTILIGLIVLTIIFAVGGVGIKFNKVWRSIDDGFGYSPPLAP